MEDFIEKVKNFYEGARSKTNPSYKDLDKNDLSKSLSDINDPLDRFVQSLNVLDNYELDSSIYSSLLKNHEDLFRISYFLVKFTKKMEGYLEFDETNTNYRKFKKNVENYLKSFEN